MVLHLSNFGTELSDMQNFSSSAHPLQAAKSANACRGNCANELSEDPFCTDYNGLSEHFNYAVPAEVIIQKVNRAIAAWKALRVG